MRIKVLFDMNIFKIFVLVEMPSIHYLFKLMTRKITMYSRQKKCNNIVR